GIAFAAALLRVWRDGDEPPTWVLVSVAVAGALLALARSASPVWLVMDLILFVALYGPRRTWRLLRARRAALIAACLLLLAVVLNRVWEHLYGPDVTLSLANPRFGIRSGWEQLGGGLEQLVIAYGYLEFRPPALLWIGWLAILAAVVGTGLWLGAR